MNDLIWVNDKSLHSEQLSKKLNHCIYNSFKIIITHDNVYELQLLLRFNAHSTFNVKLLQKDLNNLLFDQHNSELSSIKVNDYNEWLVRVFLYHISIVSIWSTVLNELTLNMTLTDICLNSLSTHKKRFRSFTQSISKFFTFSDVISVSSDVSISSFILTICWCSYFITLLKNSVSDCTEHLRSMSLTLCCRFSSWFTADIISLIFYATFDYFFFCAMRALQCFYREVMSESDTDLTWS